MPSSVTSQPEPAGVNSPAGKDDRTNRILGILERLDRLSGTPDRDTILEDERANLTDYAANGKDADTRKKVESVLK